LKLDEDRLVGADGDVATPRKPRTGLKPYAAYLDGFNPQVATPRKPRTGLKQIMGITYTIDQDVATPRKPRTGLKPFVLENGLLRLTGRDTQKTQNGIETRGRWLCRSLS